MQKSCQVALCYFGFEQLKNGILQNYAFDFSQLKSTSTNYLSVMLFFLER